MKSKKLKVKIRKNAILNKYWIYTQNIIGTYHKFIHYQCLTRKELVSRSLYCRDGLIQFDGKSRRHILGENSSQGREIFTNMMREQNEVGFSPFIDYFDFDYKPLNDMNAIVYAASCSAGPENTDDTSTRVSLLLSGGPATIESNSPRTDPVNDTPNRHKRKKPDT